MEKEFVVDIYKITGTSTPSGRTADEGEASGETIRQLILDNWDQHEKIVIHFEGVVQMTRPFVDEAFAKLLRDHSLDAFNQKLFFPDANDRIVKELNAAVKLRLKINQMEKDRAEEAAGN
jgi:hypothetical protein